MFFELLGMNLVHRIKVHNIHCAYPVCVFLRNGFFSRDEFQENKLTYFLDFD